MLAVRAYIFVKFMALDSFLPEKKIQKPLELRRLDDLFLLSKSRGRRYQSRRTASQVMRLMAKYCRFNYIPKWNPKT